MALKRKPLVTNAIILSHLRYLTEGMEEEQFIESRSNFEMLQLDYIEVQKEMHPLLGQAVSEI